MEKVLLAVLCGYLLGSIPFAYLVARSRGVDIFSVGTRNPGAANVFRSVGPVPGSTVFIADVTKGAAAVLVAVMLDVEPVGLRVLAGLAAVVGHWWPLFLRFRGGAGLATAIGAGAGTLPLIGVAAIVAGLLTQYRFRSSGYSAALGLVCYLGIAFASNVGTMALISSSAFAAVFAYYLAARFRAARFRSSRERGRASKPV